MHVCIRVCLGVYICVCVYECVYVCVLVCERMESGSLSKLRFCTFWLVYLESACPEDLPCLLYAGITSGCHTFSVSNLVSRDPNLSCRTHTLSTEPSSLFS